MWNDINQQRGFSLDNYIDISPVLSYFIKINSDPKTMIVVD